MHVSKFIVIQLSGLLLVAAVTEGRAEPATVVSASQPASRPVGLAVVVEKRPDPQTAARQLLRRAIDHYVAGRYQLTVDTLRPLVDSRVLKDTTDQMESLRTYGAALYLVGAKVAADRAFRDLLRIAADTRLDPSFVRPEVVRFFETIRDRYEQEALKEAEKRGPGGSALVNLLPPWGQFQNKQPTKAYVILGAEIGLATLSIVSGALLWSWRSPSGEFGGNEPAAEVLRPINLASFFSLAAVVIYGVADGLYYYYRGPRARKGAGAERLTIRF